MTNPQVLIIRIGALGDIFSALPAVTTIKKLSPSAEISWLVGRSLAPVLVGHPDIKTIHTLDEKKIFGASKVAALIELFRVLLRLARKYDFIFLLHRDTRWTLAFRLLFGRIYQLKRMQFKLSDRLVHPVRFPILSVNESLQVQELIHYALAEKPSPAGFVPISSEFWERFPAPAAPADRYFVFHLGGGQNLKTEFQLKQWPYWKSFLSQVLANKFEPILLVGDKSEQEYANLVVSGLPAESGRVINLVGQTNLSELIGVIRNALAFIGVDSGPLHIADAAGIACLGLYGPTSTKSWGILGSQSSVLSLNVECSPCYRDDGYFPVCPHGHICMSKLTAELVFQKFQMLMSNFHNRAFN